MTTKKYYVVWKGNATGVFDSWEEAEIQTSGYPGAQFKAYKTQEEAVEAFRRGFEDVSLLDEVSKQVAQLRKEGVKIEWKEPGSAAKSYNSNSVGNQKTPRVLPKEVIRRAIAVDGACEGNPGIGEYRGVYVETGEQLFHFGPTKDATNNIMEFLAIVHGLAFLEKQKLLIPIYSDSVSAISWVRQNRCKTTIAQTPDNEELFDLISRAELWLNTHAFRVNIYKWDTKAWGEIPADFGRK